MAQTNPVQNQPSMDDILASIRRIIDDGNKKPDATASAKDTVANDDSSQQKVQAEAVLQSKPAAVVSAAEIMEAEIPAHSEANVDQRPGSVGVPELDSFLESLDAKYESADSNVVPLEPLKETAAKSETAARTEPAAQKPRSADSQPRKYEQRFSEDDRTAFEKVGSVLAANTLKMQEVPAPQKATRHEQPEIHTAQPEARAANNYDAPAPQSAQRPSAPSYMPQTRRNLVSDQVRSTIGGSFESLSEALAKEAGRDLPGITEDLLKPMLSDWLDNNLPSMVERLVRAEIERIARGE